MFQTFSEFVNWCEDVPEITVEETDSDTIAISNLRDTDGMIVCEMMVYAYDSGFIFGPMHADLFKGSIVIRRAG